MALRLGHMTRAQPLTMIPARRPAPSLPEWRLVPAGRLPLDRQTNKQTNIGDLDGCSGPREPRRRPHRRRSPQRHPGGWRWSRRCPAWGGAFRKRGVAKEGEENRALEDTSDASAAPSAWISSSSSSPKTFWRFQRASFSSLTAKTQKKRLEGPKANGVLLRTPPQVAPGNHPEGPSASRQSDRFDGDRKATLTLAHVLEFVSEQSVI